MSCCVLELYDFFAERRAAVGKTDFGRAGQDASRGVVLLRISQTSSKSMAERVRALLASRGDWVGHFGCRRFHGSHEAIATELKRTPSVGFAILGAKDDVTNNLTQRLRHGGMMAQRVPK